MDNWGSVNDYSNFAVWELVVKFLQNTVPVAVVLTLQSSVLRLGGPRASGRGEGGSRGDRLRL